MRGKSPSVSGIGALLLTSLVAGCNSESSVRNQSPDPVVEDFPVAFVVRPILDEEGERLEEDLLRPENFQPGARLVLKDRAAPAAAETILTDGVFEPDALYDVKDLTVSYDGLQLLFAMRAPELEDADDDEQPSWNLWRFDRSTGELERVIGDDLTAEAGQDVAPQFLPDGRIVFSSTRQRSARAILLDEGKPQYTALDEDRDGPAFNLHVMDPDGSNIQQLTFNLSHDLDPWVRADGSVIFSRWDNAGGRSGVNLYRMQPDGTDQQILYGWHSHDSGSDGDRIQFVKPIEVEDGRLMVMLHRGQNQMLGGEISYLDVDGFSDIDQPLPDNQATVDAQVSASYGEVRTDDAISSGGRIHSVFPLFDGTERLLLSWSGCQLELQPPAEEGGEEGTEEGAEPPQAEILPCNDDNLALEGVTEAAPGYGLWVFDPSGPTQQPIVLGEAGIAVVEPVVMQSRARPAFIADKQPGAELEPGLYDSQSASLHIRSVYDFDGVDTAGIASLADPMLTTAAERPARYLRVIRGVPMPPDELVDLDGTAFGRSQAQLMREIVGYTPIQPDGSVMVQLPANVPLAISVLDAQGRRIGERHQQWLSFRPGEQASCSGCHSSDSSVAHGRSDAAPGSAHPGAPATGLPYPNTKATLFADEGETMAQVNSRINGLPGLSTDLLFSDIWTDPAMRAEDPDERRSYEDLMSPAPDGAGCFSNWQHFCRLTINYPEHIHPIWEVDRQVFDPVTDELVRDDSCLSCHGIEDADGNPQVPASQLDLRGVPSSDEPDHLTSYRELLFPDLQQELINDALLDRLVPVLDGNGNPIFEVDIDGNLILDENGDPIPVTTTVGVNPVLSVNGALTSGGFFNRFNAGGSHAGRLSDAELKLIAEWLDIGGQYYNTPFFQEEQ